MTGDKADRCLWQMKGGEGPPARGMSRSDKGSAGSGEDEKVTSGQEGHSARRSTRRLLFRLNTVQVCQTQVYVKAIIYFHTQKRLAFQLV